jgi:hypothetical protein
MLSKLESAATNAPSVRTASPSSCRTSVRTAAADSFPDRSGRRPNGGPDSRWPSGLPPPRASRSRTHEKRLRRWPTVSAKSRLINDDHRDRRGAQSTSPPRRSAVRRPGATGEHLTSGFTKHGSLARTIVGRQASPISGDQRSRRRQPDSSLDRRRRRLGSSGSQPATISLESHPHS